MRPRIIGLGELSMVEYVGFDLSKEETEEITGWLGVRDGNPRQESVGPWAMTVRCVRR